MAARFVCARSVVFCQNFWKITQRLPGNWRGGGKRFSGAFRAGAPSPLACLLLACPFFLVPTTSKRLWRRLQRNKNGDSWLLEKLFVLFIQDWKLHAIVDKNLFWKLAREKFNETRQNLGRQQKWKANLQTEVKRPINGAWEQNCSIYSVGYKSSEATWRAASFAFLQRCSCGECETCLILPSDFLSDL